MNTAQTLLSFGALILLGSTVLAVSSSSVEDGVVRQQTEIGMHAVSLAMGRIEEATGKAFDEYTVPDATGATGKATSVTQFTSPSVLGPEPGEHFPDFDDIDDFNGLTTTVYIPGVDTMNVHSEVGYINPVNPYLVSGSKSWHKRLVVSVSGSTGSDTVRISSILSYWWHR